jgi:hypothetical protein
MNFSGSASSSDGDVALEVSGVAVVAAYADHERGFTQCTTRLEQTLSWSAVLSTLAFTS